MRLLIDTQIYLWVLEDSSRLSRRAVRVMKEADGVYVSSATIWEASIKIRKGSLKIDPSILVAYISESGMHELPVLASHAVLVATMPTYHKDPFDRLIVAQAMQETMRLLTSDTLLQRYSPLVELV